MKVCVMWKTNWSTFQELNNYIFILYDMLQDVLILLNVDVYKKFFFVILHNLWYDMKGGFRFIEIDEQVVWPSQAQGYRDMVLDLWISCWA